MDLSLSFSASLQRSSSHLPSFSPLPDGWPICSFSLAIPAFTSISISPDTPWLLECRSKPHSSYISEMSKSHQINPRVTYRHHSLKDRRKTERIISVFYLFIFISSVSRAGSCCISQAACLVISWSDRSEAFPSLPKRLSFPPYATLAFIICLCK